MQCSRCLTELPDATTYCSNCGSFLRSDPTGASTVFSYLPAGAPPWPTTVPQNLRGATGPTVDAAGSNQNKTFHAQHPANRRSSPAYTVTRSGQYSGYALYARPIILWRGADKRQPAIREQVKLPFPHPYCYSCTTNQCFARSGAF